MTVWKSKAKSARRVCWILGALFGLIWLFSGCVVQSLTPFYQEGSVIPMPQLDGAWRLIVDSGKDVSGKLIRPWSVRQGRVQTFDDKGAGSVLKIHFFKVEGTTFVDVTANAPKKGKLNKWWLFHATPVHTVCKVIPRGDRLLLIPLDPYWMEKAGADAARALPHIKPVQGEDDIYFPSPAVWMKFLKDHRQDKAAFLEDERCELERVKAHPKQGG